MKRSPEELVDEIRSTLTDEWETSAQISQRVEYGARNTQLALMRMSSCGSIEWKASRTQSRSHKGVYRRQHLTYYYRRKPMPAEAASPASPSH